MPRRRLPPLKSLVYFEAAARLQSFTRASAELNVTQGAVSRQIRQLEQFLGKSLFTREKRQIFLTDDGHNYYVSISHLLQQIGEVTDDLLSPEEPDQVTLVTSSALASMYLLPRIPAFRQIHSDIQIRIVARDDLLELDKSEYDIALYYCRQPPDKYKWVELFRENVFPVCSPAYLDTHSGQFDSPEGLDTNLIWLESDEDWINWPEWLQAMNIGIKSYHNRLVVNHYPMVIQAALAGQGVALAWANLVDTELERGALVRPVDMSLSTEAGFYLMLPAGRTPRRQTEIFRDWLYKNR
ncbi:MAG: LysR substrate-binding domain-containing protein [bacterium]